VAETGVKIRILLTAFGAFPGAPQNPTRALVARVARMQERRFARLGIELAIAELPVVYAGAEARAAELVAQIQPHCVLHLGLAAKRRRLTLETRARNRVSVLRADAQGKVAEKLLLERGGPAERRARMALAGGAAAVRAAGAPCALSIDAGDYLCNQTLWATLAGTSAQAGFLHVPRPGRVGLDAMASGIAALLILMARQARAASAPAQRQGASGSPA
jgi:pyroglutamyl-peptidase